MKHFKHREKPKFCVVDWLVFLEGGPVVDGKRAEQGTGAEALVSSH